jgi:hypothetical protein
MWVPFSNTERQFWIYDAAKLDAINPFSELIKTSLQLKSKCVKFGAVPVL